MYLQLALSLTEQGWRKLPYEVTHLAPTPADEWKHTLAFLGFGTFEKAALSRSIEALMRHTAELVAHTHEHLQKFLKTPAILGWEESVDAENLEERRFGYHIARQFETGDLPIRVKLFGTLRPVIGKSEVIIRVNLQDTVAKVLGKLLNYYPEARIHALESYWDTEEKSHSEWLEIVPVYIFRKGWRILLNGRDLSYEGGYDCPITAQDEIAIFPPGR